MSQTDTESTLHRLKNHLTVILGFADLLLESVSGETARQDVLEIRKAAEAALVEVERLEPRDTNSGHRS